jgi:putative transposase
VLGAQGLVHDREEGPQTLGEAPWTPVHDDLVQRDFSAPGPDVVWLTDITEHPTAKGKLYACCIKDVFSNRIVGCATGERMTADLAVSALRQAVARRQPEGTVVVHSDRGANFERGPSWRCSRTGTRHNEYFTRNGTPKTCTAHMRLKKV